MKNTSVKFVSIDEAEVGQRIDNFLLKQFKGVPKSRVYKALRKGEVRVNRGRIKPEYRLQAGDEVRLPPMPQKERVSAASASTDLRQRLEQRIIYEDGDFILINKLPGLPVHGGSEVSAGLIETLRLMRPQAKLVELVHRLDKDTSGCLLVAKKRSVLAEVQRLWREHRVTKQYLALVKGAWQGGRRTVNLPLRKNVLSSGERIVKVDKETGRAAKSIFEPIWVKEDHSLLLVTLVTGRTHQIRVHAQALGHPVIGDRRYGDRDFNTRMRQGGMKRLFLHSARLGFAWREGEKQLDVCAPLDGEWICS